MVVQCDVNSVLMRQQRYGFLYQTGDVLQQTTVGMDLLQIFPYEANFISSDRSLLRLTCR